MMLMACPSFFCASCTGTGGIRLSGLSLVSRPGPEGSDCQQNQTANKELQALQHQAAPVFCSTALTSSQIQAGGGDNCRRELRYSATLAGRIFPCHTHTHWNAQILTWKWAHTNAVCEQFGPTLRSVFPLRLLLQAKTVLSASSLTYLESNVHTQISCTSTHARTPPSRCVPSLMNFSFHDRLQL